MGGEIRKRVGDARSTVHQAIENNPGPAGIRAPANGLGKRAGDDSYRIVRWTIETKPERRSLSDAMGERVRRMIMIMVITDVIWTGISRRRWTQRNRKGTQIYQSGIGGSGEMYQVQLQKVIAPSSSYRERAGILRLLRRDPVPPQRQKLDDIIVAAVVAVLKAGEVRLISTRNRKHSFGLLDGSCFCALKGQR